MFKRIFIITVLILLSTSLMSCMEKFEDVQLEITGSTISDFINKFKDKIGKKNAFDVVNDHRENKNIIIDFGGDSYLYRSHYEEGSLDGIISGYVLYGFDSFGIFGTCRHIGTVFYTNDTIDRLAFITNALHDLDSMKDLPTLIHKYYNEDAGEYEMVVKYGKYVLIYKVTVKDDIMIIVAVSTYKYAKKINFEF